MSLKIFLDSTTGAGEGKIFLKEGLYGFISFSRRRRRMRYAARSEFTWVVVRESRDLSCRSSVLK